MDRFGVVGGKDGRVSAKETAHAVRMGLVTLNNVKCLAHHRTSIKHVSFSILNLTDFN